MIGLGAMRRGPLSPVTVDRILLGVCAAIWLALLGVSVAAIVALVDLGRGFHQAARNPQTGLLYVVIGVSALVIVIAIPVLLYARADHPGATMGAAARGTPIRAGHPTAHRRAATRIAVESAAGPPVEDVDRIWLRATASLASAAGAALVAVAVATYLMALAKDGAAWGCYAVAGVITVAMPVIPWLYVRQLQQLVAASR